MKVIHDIKNPILAAQAIIDSSNINKDDKELVNSELNDMLNLLEDLKIEFKYKNGMKFKENKEWKKTKDVVQSLMAANKKMAINGNNALEFSVSKRFPE